MTRQIQFLQQNQNSTQDEILYHVKENIELQDNNINSSAL